MATTSILFLIIFSFISNYGNIVSKSKLLEMLTTFSVSGYAIPGVILAVAFITFIAWFDNNIVMFFGSKTIKSFFILILLMGIRFYYTKEKNIVELLPKLLRPLVLAITIAIMLFIPPRVKG